jgi:hypothetical protein
MLEIALLTICVLIIIIYFINSYEKFENTNSFEKIKEISVTPDLSISNVNSLVEKAFTEILFNFENKRYILKNLFQVILLQNGTLRFTALLIDQDAKTEISVDVVFSSDYTKILDMKLTPYVDTTKPGYTPNCLAPFSVLPKDDLILTDQLYSAYQEELKKQSEKSYLCFGTQYNDLITKEDCEAAKGFWDSPVTNSNDCPYYKANKNYTNVRGFSKNGYCELPSGLLNLGYRDEVKDPLISEALCYNCTEKLIGQGSLGTCCESQKNNPRFVSPDYKFSGDSLDRNNAALELKSRNLLVA